MNFYPFHIGDYASATRHLSWAEDLAYRRLLDVYYVKEAPLPAEARAVYRLVLATTDEQREAVDAVLAEFFELTADGYRHKRCDLELAAAKDKSAKAAQSARARWGDAKQQDVALPGASTTHSDRTATAPSDGCERTEEACEGNAPKTNPKTNTKEEAKASSKPAAYEPPDWVPLESWGEFVVMRKAMRGVPFTAAAARGVVAELDKLRAQGFDPAEMLQRAVTNGWRTVYAPKPGTTTRPAETVYQQSQRERVAEFAPGVAKRPSAIDVEVKNVVAVASR